MQSTRVRVTALLAGLSLVVSLAGCDDNDQVKSPEPTAAPTPGVGQLVSIAGDGTSMGWNGESPAAGHSIGDPGIVVALPSGGLMLTSDIPPQTMRLEPDGLLTDLKARMLIGWIVAGAVDADTGAVGMLREGVDLLVMSPIDGAVKRLARLPSVDSGERSTTSLVRRTGGWWVQRGAEVVSVSDGGKVSPVKLPVVPMVLASDGAGLLAAIKGGVVRIAEGKVTDRMSLRGLDVSSASTPVAMVADGKGGVYVALTDGPAIAHASPNAAPELLLKGKAEITRCAEVSIGDPLRAPLVEIGALAIRNGDLVIADRRCSKLYQYGLPR